MSVALKEGPNHLGRGEDCDIRISDAGVSRMHCKVVVNSQGLEVEDFASTNGTYVAGRQIDRVPLQEGDVLQLGQNVSLRYLRVHELYEESTYDLAGDATLDTLTGVPDARSWLKMARERIPQTLALGKPVSVALASLDGYDQVEARHGYAPGPLLSEFCRRAIQVGSGVVIGRLKEDLFGLYMPGFLPHKAHSRLERLRRDVEGEPFLLSLESEGLFINVTVSLAVATALRPEDASLDELLRQARRGLSQARKAGGNCVQIVQSAAAHAPQPEPEPLRQKRAWSRWQLEGSVSCYAEEAEEPEKANLVDLGFGGVCLEGDFEWTVGTVYDLVLRGKPSIVRAEVLWHREGRAGLSFQDARDDLRHSWVWRALRDQGMNKESLKDRRRSSRLSWERAIRFKTLQGSLPGMLVDLSLDGFCVTASRIPEVGAPCRLDLPNLKLEGRVCWTSPSYFGASFTPMKEASRAALRQFLQERLQTP